MDDQANPGMTGYKYINVRCVDAVLEVQLARPEKSNAIHHPLLDELDDAFARKPASVKAVLIHGAGKHFCAGMDLVENASRSAVDAMKSSRRWHQVFDRIQFCGIPVVALLHGAVIGGGLELALACHVRVATPSSWFQLPEAQRGLFVGGGASVRASRVLGADRMVALMLTGAVYDADVGHRLGLSHFLVPEAEGLSHARDLVQRLSENDPLSNLFAMTAIPHINDMPREAGLFTEALVVAVAQSGNDAGKRLAMFERRRKVFIESPTDAEARERVE